MTCTEHETHSHGPSDFCTRCGADLRTAVPTRTRPRTTEQTPVQDMVGKERQDWITSVWCTPARARR